MGMQHEATVALLPHCISLVCVTSGYETLVPADMLLQ